MIPGISPIQLFSAKICLQNIREYSDLRDEFPARQNRELIRDNRETIPPYQARNRETAENRSARSDEALFARRRLGLSAPPAGETSQQHRHDSGDENAVEGSGAADRCDRRPEVWYFRQVEQVGPDQRPQASRDIGERSRVSPRNS